MPNTTSAEVDLPGVELDPKVKPWLRPDDLTRYGFGDRKTVYAAIKKGQIPSTRIGRKLLIPTSWVCRRLQGPDEAQATTPHPAA